jgi:delta-aminolevulinic acid dehydratase/porphobilinogen synthase
MPLMIIVKPGFQRMHRKSQIIRNMKQGIRIQKNSLMLGITIKELKHLDLLIAVVPRKMNVSLLITMKKY